MRQRSVARAAGTEEPLQRLWEIKTSAAAEVVAEVPTPVSEPPEQPAARIDTVKFAADLLEVDAGTRSGTTLQGPATDRE